MNMEMSHAYVTSSAVPPDLPPLLRRREPIEHLPESADQVHLEISTRPEDMPEIRALHAECFPLNYDDSFFSSVEEHSVKSILAKYDNRLFGVLVYRTGESNSLPCGEDVADYADQVAYLMTLGVAEECRGRGVSSLLLGKAMSMVSDMDGVYLHVADYNKQAIDIYKHHGFAQVAIKKDFYQIKGKHYGAITLFKSFRPPKRRTLLDRFKQWWAT